MIPEIIAKDKKLCDVVTALKDVAGETGEYLKVLYSEEIGPHVGVSDIYALIETCEKEQKKMANFLRVVKKRGY